MKPTAGSPKNPEWWTRLWRAAVLVLTSLLGLPWAGMAAQINPPIGSHVNLQPEDFAGVGGFRTNDPVVLTSYFYWYDIFSGAHLTDSDGTDALTDHPPTLTGFSYKLSAWHRQQLLDMIDAGIDVLLPVYWGEPSQRIVGKPVADQPWSFAGLPPLVAAREGLLAEGKAPPRIGMFYDTSTLQYNAAGQRIDLTTDSGRQWFYESIRDFFSLIPSRHWAMIDGKPIVFLYAASFAAAHDQTCIDYVRQQFARDFGGHEPYLVREISWNVAADNTYAWGGALSLRNPGVAALGPGYDHSAVPGREPLVVPRENGAFFERNWTRFLRNPSRLVHIETWNEYHEGTDIAASKEYGRQYLALNRKFADLFRAGLKPPRPRGPFSDSKSVSVMLRATNESRGLVQFEFADGATAPAEAGGQPCRAVATTVHAGRYVYFRIDDSFKWADEMLVDVEVEYFDSSFGSFLIEYDGPDPNAPFNGAYTASKIRATLGNSGQWKVAKFRLLRARFLNSQNGGADFRIAVQAQTLNLGRITVTRPGMPAEAGATLRGWQHDFADPLGTNWLTVGDAHKVFKQADGMLQAAASQPGRSLLLADTPGIAGTDFEALARVRPVERPGSADWLGGVALAGQPVSTQTLKAVLRWPPGDTPRLEWLGSRDTVEAQGAGEWELNRWYWMRIHHLPNAVTGYPDLWARLWPADGETPEPNTWTAWWNYFPAVAAARGLVGIIAGAGVLEWDYFLVMSGDLPEINVRLPALKPRRVRLVLLALDNAAGMELALQGEPQTRYALEHSSDLQSWTGDAVTTDGTGLTRFTDSTAKNEPRRFYRARSIP